jgi:hypothetical protein
MHGRNHRPKGWYGPDDPGGSDPLNWLRSGAQDRYEDVILELGPLAFWKLDEQSGTTAADSSGNGYHLADGDDVDWGRAALPPGATSARFDSAAALLTRPDTDFPALTGDMSAIVWMRQASDTSQGPFLIQGSGGWDKFGQRGWGIGWGLAQASIAVRVGGGGATEAIHSTGAPSPGTPTLVGFTRSGNVFRLYLDGVKVAEGTLTAFGSLTNTRVGIGNDLTAPGTFFASADLSYAAVWDKTLTDAQMLTLYDTVPGGGRWVIAPYTINPNVDTLVFAEGTGAVTLPTASGRAGYTVTVKRVGAGTITVTAHGTEQIDGSGSPGTVSLSTSHAAVTVASDAVGWRILHKYL